MTLEIEIDRSRGDGVVVVSFAGELDLAGTDRASAALRDGEGSSPSLLVIDLDRLEFIDSSGVRVLIEANDRARDGGHRLVVTRGGGEVARAGRLLGLDELLTIADDLDVALQL